MARIWEDDKDYMQEMQEAEAAGDLTRAAEAEKKRNAKINDLGLDYAKTNKYTAYRPFEYKDFEYDHTKDSSYQAYAKEYTRNMKRATEDVLGQYAGMTGGMPSTAAMGAATQAGALEMQKLTDKIPELEALAYERWANERNRAYDEHRDTRDFAWKQRTDAMDRAQYDKEYADKQAWAQKEWDYDMLQDQTDRGKEHFQITGDAGGLPDEWFTPEAKQMWTDAWNKSQHKDSFAEAMEMAADGVALKSVTDMYPELTEEEKSILKSLAINAFRDSSGSVSSPGAKIKDDYGDDEEDEPTGIMPEGQSETEELTLDGVNPLNITRLGLKGVSTETIHKLVDEGYLTAGENGGAIILEWAEPGAQMRALAAGLI